MTSWERSGRRQDCVGARKDGVRAVQSTVEVSETASPDCTVHRVADLGKSKYTWEDPAPPNTANSRKTGQIERVLGARPSASDMSYS